MTESLPAPDLATEGEAVSPECSFTWINPQRIEAGETLAPAKLSSPKACEFAASHLILADLTFAQDCLKQAYEMGIPDNRNLQSTALIFSGVVGYARCFKTGVRSIKLEPTEMASKGATFDQPIHDYLIAFRDKHIAHSVNDFEECQAVAIVVGTPNLGWRDGSGVGFITKRSVGISRLLLKRAIEHIERTQSFVTADLEKLRLEVYAEFKEAFEKDKKWEMAPIIHFSDRKNVAKRRS